VLGAKAALNTKIPAINTVFAYIILTSNDQHWPDPQFRVENL